MRKLQAELQQAALGQKEWQSAAAEPDTFANLHVPRGSEPLSLWNWKVWAQARPTLWRSGAACNLYPWRPVPLLTHAWITCMCLREEMEYSLDDDETPFRARASDAEPEVNRFADDWITLHLFSTLFYLTERHQSAFAFLKNGGMKWAEKVRHLTPETLANSARLQCRRRRSSGHRCR